MTDVYRSEWVFSDQDRFRLRTQVVLAPLDVTPYRMACSSVGCLRDAFRERVSDGPYPYRFTCEYGHSVDVAAQFRL